MFTPATESICEALRALGNAAGLVVSMEYRLRPWKARQSERIDVVLRLPSGRPAIWFEIDNHPDRASHNILKMFGDPVSLAQLPVYTVGIRYGRAALKAIYADEIAKEFILPPRFLDIIGLTDTKIDAVYQTLKERLASFLMDFGPTTLRQTVREVCAQYQELLCHGNIGVATAHLEARAELAWFLAKRS